MNQDATDLLRRLNETVFFGNCSSSEQVPNWPAALELSDSLEWENLGLDQQAVLIEAAGRPADWNDVVIEVRREVDALIATKLTHGVAPIHVRGRVQWDLMMVVVQIHYLGCGATGFYADVGASYLAGRFPCHWIGEFPEGHLLEY